MKKLFLMVVASFMATSMFAGSDLIYLDASHYHFPEGAVVTAVIHQLMDTMPGTAHYNTITMDPVAGKNNVWSSPAGNVATGQWVQFIVTAEGVFVDSKEPFKMVEKSGYNRRMSSSSNCFKVDKFCGEDRYADWEEEHYARWIYYTGDIIDDKVGGVDYDTESQSLVFNWSWVDEMDVPATAVSTTEEVKSIVIDGQNTILASNNGIVISNNLTICSNTSDENPDTLKITAPFPLRAKGNVDLVLDGVNLVLLVSVEFAPGRRMGADPCVICGFNTVTFKNCEIVEPAGAQYVDGVGLNFNGEPVKYAVIATQKMPTAIDNVNVNDNISKTIVNGQIIIIREGVRYNAMGQIVE